MKPRNQNFLWILVSVSLIAIIVGCSKKLDKKTVLAEAGSAKVTVDDLVAYSEISGPLYQSSLSTPQGREVLVDALLGDKIVEESAKQAGLGKDKNIKEAIKQYQSEAKKAEERFISSLFKNAYISELSKREINVTDTEIRDYYDEHKAWFAKPVRSLMSHVLCADEQTAQAALQRLKNGEDFAAVAREFSVDPNAHGGRLGIIGDIGPEDMTDMPEIMKAANELQTGQYSGVIKTKIGYHIFKKNGEVNLPEQNYTQAAPRIRNMLIDRKLQNWIAEKKKEMRAEINKSALKNIAITVGNQKFSKKR